MSIRNFSLLFAVAAALTGSAFAQTTFTRTTSYAFPVVGLGSTESIGVNLSNMAANPTSGTASSCTGSVTFANASGAVIGTATTFTLAANAATSINLTSSSAGISGTRGLIHATVASTTTSGVPCQLSFSLNTFDTSSGATHIFLPGSSIVSASGFGNPIH